MQVFSTDPKTDRSLQHSLKDGAAFAVMAGIGETYISAFALFLRATTPQIGLLASLPPLLASLALLLSAWLGRLTGHRKVIIVAGATLQGCTWIPMLALPLLFPQYALPMLIGCAVIYYSGANLAAPQWTSLMGDLVPPRRRGRFFGVRTRLITAVTFTALIVGGLVLQVSTDMGNTLAGFAVLFSVAACARLISVYHLAKMYDPPGHVATLDVPGGRRWLQRLRHSNAVRFSVFFALIQFSVAISAPFFTVYLLRDLQVSYLTFTGIIGTAILMQFVTLSRWGRISDVFGNRRILASTGVMIIVMPSLWLLSTSFWYLLLIQICSGFAWAGFNLSAGNFIYDLMAPHRRASYLAVHNVLASIGIFCGALLGGYLATLMPAELDLFGTTYSWVSPLYGVFVFSSLIRGLVIALLIPKLQEVRRARPISNSQLIFRAARVNALAGIVFDVVGARSRKD